METEKNGCVRAPGPPVFTLLNDSAHFEVPKVSNELRGSAQGAESALGPAGRRQLDAPVRALQVHGPLELHEPGRGPGRDPVAQVGRVLAHERCHDASETAQLYLHEVARGRARDVAHQELVFALRAQLGVEKVRSAYRVGSERYSMS